jgi:uncharacterized membrane protein YidH (DUF202 family)
MKSQSQAEESLQAIHDIRGMMERSARFLSLSGWSGIWAGGTALVGAAIGHEWLLPVLREQNDSFGAYTKPLIVAILIFIVAFAGAYYFTWRKMRREGTSLWHPASKQLILAVALPMVVGGVFVLAFMYNGHPVYIASACLAFYGLALVNGSKHTVTDIRYLGYLEILLGCICLLIPGLGFWFWVIGFGILHILYGIIMWNKYDKQPAA